MPRTSLFQAYKAPIAVLLTLALALGTVAYRRITVALFPEVTFPKVKVIADNGLVPVDRMMVTRPFWTGTWTWPKARA
jgi:hypothetical protein